MCIFPLGKFLPMKTMLGPRYDDQVAEENRFHPSMLSNYLKSLKVSNFMVIDTDLICQLSDMTLKMHDMTHHFVFF